jgi:hypothetical protein
MGRKNINKTIPPKRHLINPDLERFLNYESFSKWDTDYIIKNYNIALFRHQYQYYIFFIDRVKELDGGCFNSVVEQIRDMNPDEAIEHLTALYKNDKLKFTK